PDEIVGHPIAEIVGREAFEQLLPEFSQVLEGVPVRSEKEVVFAGLGPRWIQATYTPTLDPSGVADGWVAVVHDIDELRRAEEALKELDRRKDDFLALLGHELRNPLAPIHNAVDLLERVGSDAPPAREARAIIRRQTAHITRLLDDLLDLSRIARGKIALRTQRCDLGRIARDTVDDYGAVLLDAGLALRLAMPSEAVWVDGDPARLSQILGNLLHNARKFTPPGGEILVAVGRSSSGMAEVEVRDTGVGIPRRVLERIFEPFVQADDNVDRGRGGLGLGLSLVKGIVDL